MKCENCGNEHDGSYGSGRFCSKSCRCSFNAKKQKHFASKDQLQKRKGFGAKAKENGWKCSKCGLIFRTSAELRQHLRDAKHQRNDSAKAWNKGLTAGTSESIAKGIKTYKQHLNEGKFHNPFLGRKRTEEEKEKIRKGTVKYITTVIDSRPRYNKSSIPILTEIAKEYGWNIQHAENGGEFYTGIGYFVDAYDKEKNIVLEFDEAAHYADVENNILKEKDLMRQKKIIDHLHCEYWRYNSVMKQLWKVKQ